MSLEGLQAILEKEEIVATQRAEDLLSRPDIVDRVYQGHVRTYIPLSRQAPGNENGQSVIEFERRVIREIKQSGAIRGYITAEYGHGKTSTALYLWQRAREENILAVPPFQLNKLTDFIRAAYGWARYEIQRTRPQSSAVQAADDLYKSLIERGAESIARQYNMTLADAQRMAREKPEILELIPADYIRFFEEMTNLAQEAGFEGLLIIADELQQYIDPEIKQGIKDPISPFFDIVSAILTRRNHLKFGLIVVIPPKELSQLRDARGDLIHRVLQVSLDLRTVYNQEFPQRLWDRLAKEFKFQEYQAQIINADCLAALGQIGARGDLSDGPRTIVNTLRRATHRYIESGQPADSPYTPETLVNDLLQGNIQYDSSKRIAQVTARVLAHSLVKGQPERERAIKWAAAFPNEGVTMNLQESYGLAAAFSDLAQSGLGDLIISVGDVRNRGFTLRELQEAPIKTDWLSLMLREFGRNYFETAATVEERALKGFLSLLKTKVFPSNNQWSVIKEVSARMTQNSGLILEGSFTSSRLRFPERTVHARILWEDEAIKDAHAEGDALVEIRLRRYLDRKESERRHQADPMEIDFEGRCLRLTLNMMRRSLEPAPNLEEQVSAYISPFKLTPLLLLSLHQALDEERERNAIPKADDQFIRYNFQSDLVDHAFRELFNETVGTAVEAAQERILEIGLYRLFEAIYPNYEPLIVVSNWTSSLQKYRNALAHLETNYEKQGQIVVDGTKEQIANLFTLSNTGLDSFARNFPALISDVSKLPGKGSGSVRFTLHPLEKAIKQWVQESPQKEMAQAAGKGYELHRLPNHEIYDRARVRGYIDKEIDAILELMIARGMVEQDTRRGYVREAITQAPSVDELESDVDEWLGELKTLREAFPGDKLLANSQEEADKAKKATAELRSKPNEKYLIQSRRRVLHERQQLSVLAEDKHKALSREAINLLHRLPSLDTRIKTNLEKSLHL
jgi:DNA-binding transcriptional regulator of glucitol operon